MRSFSLATTSSGLNASAAAAVSISAIGFPAVRPVPVQTV
jgi:hypothetical protein